MTKIPCWTGVTNWWSAGSDNMYRRMVMALLTYHLSNVSNLYLILGNLLFVRLDVGPWHRDSGTKSLGLALGAKSLAFWPWPWVPTAQVLVNITDHMLAA